MKNPDNTSVKSFRRFHRKLGRPRLLTTWTADLLKQRADAYFAKCDKRTKIQFDKDGGSFPAPDPAPYTHEGLLVYLDITRHQWRKWIAEDSELGSRARRIHLAISANRVEGALDGSQSASFAQFVLKNTDPDQYRDKVELDHSLPQDLISIFKLCEGSPVK